MIIDLFKVSISSTDLTFDLTELKNLIENGKIFNINDIKFEQLKKELNSSIMDYAKALKLSKKNNIKIDKAWVNINSKNDYFKKHAHPECSISGVFYISTPEGSGNIRFFRPDYQYIKRYRDYMNLDIFEKELMIKKGKLYLFPSWLEHQVDQCFNVNENRISIAFNAK